MRELNGASASVLADAGIFLLRAPTRQSWAVTKLYVLQGARVNVDLTCEVGDVKWAKVSMTSGNMEGWAPLEQLFIKPSSNVSQGDMSATSSGWTEEVGANSPRSAPGS